MDDGDISLATGMAVFLPVCVYECMSSVRITRGWRKGKKLRDAWMVRYQKESCTFYLRRGRGGSWC